MTPPRWKLAISITVCVLGCVAALALAASMVLDAGDLDRGALARLPQCEARRAGGSCVLCGLGHSFIALSRGRLDEAVNWNPAGPWIYAGFLVLVIAGVTTALWVFHRSTCGIWLTQCKVP